MARFKPDERVDPGWFEDLYENDRVGRPALDPRGLLKVILYGYARGKKSSRALERACKQNLVFMALAGGQKPDHSTLAAFVGKMSGRKIERLFAEVLVACHSEENLAACEAEKLDAIIPDNNFRKRDPQFESRERHKAKVRKIKEKLPMEAFEYDERRDLYTCPQGKELALYAARHDNGKGHIYRRYRAAEGACQGCPLASKCLSAGAKRKSLAIPVHERKKKLCEQMREKIDTPAARKRYGRRAGIVEPVFANIRYCKAMDRFTYRRKKKVNTQWQLFCLVHNLEKLAKYGKKYGKTPGKEPLAPLFSFCEALIDALRIILCQLFCAHQYRPA